MNNANWDEANSLASNHYTISIEQDTLSNGQTIYLLRHPELPGCKAQGSTFDEAKTNLDEARVDYIYALLESGLEVPDPRPMISNKTYIFDASSKRQDEFEGVLDRVIQPEHRKVLSSYALEGDLIKHN